MKKNLQIGDLVWYNTGGNGKETVGMIIDHKKIVYRHASPWENKDKEYKDAIRVQWLRKGKLVPKPIPVPFYDCTVALALAAPAHDASVEYGTNPYGPKLQIFEDGAAIYESCWYEGQWFKVISSVEKK